MNAKQSYSDSYLKDYELGVTHRMHSYSNLRTIFVNLLGLKEFRYISRFVTIIKLFYKLQDLQLYTLVIKYKIMQSVLSQTFCIRTNGDAQSDVERAECEYVTHWLKVK